MNMLENWSAKAVYFVQNYRYLFLDEVLCIYCATHSVSFLVSPFVQLKGKSNMAAIYFFNGDQLAKVVRRERASLDPCNMIERSLDPCNMTEVTMKNILNY